jgi:hypothetical protein
MSPRYTIGATFQLADPRYATQSMFTQQTTHCAQQFFYCTLRNMYRPLHVNIYSYIFGDSSRTITHFKIKKKKI